MVTYSTYLKLKLQICVMLGPPFSTLLKFKNRLKELNIFKSTSFLEGFW